MVARRPCAPRFASLVAVRRVRLAAGIAVAALAAGIAYAAFPASAPPPPVPAILRPAVLGVTGFENYTRGRALAIRPGGLTPADVIRFYDIGPLVTGPGKLTGAGETVVLPEQYDAQFLPQIRRDLARWA